MNKIKKVFLRLYRTGLFSIFISTVLTKAITFCQSLIVVRLLSKADYGLFGYCNNIIGMIMILNGLGATSGILQFGAECAGNKEKKNAFIIFGSQLGLATNILMTIFVIIASFTMDFEIEGAKTILLIMSMQPVFNCLFDILSTNLRINFDNNKFSTLNIVYVVVSAVGIVLGAWLWEVKGIAWANYFIMAITISLAIIMNKKYIFDLKNHCKLSSKEKRIFVKHSVFTAFANASSQLMMLLDMFVIGIVVADELVLADYKAASAIPTALYFIPQAAMIYFYPHFVAKKDDREWVKKSVIALYLSLFVISIIIGVTLIAIAPWLIRIIFGEQYMSAVPIFRILIVSFMVGCFLKNSSYNLIVAFRKTTFNFVFCIVEGLLNVGLNVWFVTSKGSIGAAVATLLVTCISCVGHFIYLITLLRKHFRGEQLVESLDDMGSEETDNKED